MSEGWGARRVPLSEGQTHMLDTKAQGDAMEARARSIRDKHATRNPQEQ